MPSIVKKPLGIALLGVNERDRARLELFIDHHWSSNCLLVAEEYADLCILDLDSLDGKKILKQQQERHTKRPLIALSVHDTEIKNGLLLCKPINGDKLKRAIDGHMTALFQQSPMEQDPTPITKPKQNPVTKPTPVNQEEPSTAITQFKVNDRRSSLPDTATQARIIRGSCGPSGSMELGNQSYSSNLYYDPSRHFQQTLKSAVEQCRRAACPIRVNLPDEKYITLLPENNIALTNLSDSKLRPRCLIPVKSHQIHIDHLSESEDSLMRADTEAPQDIDGLLWKVTLWSARGRLPLGTNIDSMIALQHWPNLTRLLATPQFLRIAALWVKTPLSLSKTTERLNIEARYVCAFFSACNALELTETQSTTENGIVLESEKKSVASKGLLRRILHRLRVV